MYPLFSKCLRFGLICYFLSYPAHLLEAQTNAGSLTGSVVDSSGGAVPSAHIAAKNDQTGRSVETISSESGAFTLPQLAPGNYTLSVSARGFKAAERTGVIVQVNQTQVISVGLETGDVSQTVTVVASAPSLETQTSDVGSVVNPRQMVELPLSLGNGQMRTPIDFVSLTPGTAGNSNTLRIAGGQSLASEILLDGITLNTSSGANFDAAGFTPSVDALQEFKVFQGGIPAQFGRTAGGLTSFVTRSGTNEFHGLGYDIFRNTALDANTWFNNGYRAQCSPGDSACQGRYKTPDDKKNDYGLTFGGPVWIPKVYDGRNRTFFFYSWEQYLQSKGNSNVQTVPTAANRNGDFSGTLDTSSILGANPCTNGPIYKGQIFDPSTTRSLSGQLCRDPFPGNIVPANRFSAVSQKALSFVPLPQNGLLLNNFTYPSSYKVNITAQTIRIDHSFSERNKVFATYNPHEYDTPCIGAPAYGGAGDPGCTQQTTVLHDARAGYDHIFSATLLNHLAVGFDRFSNVAIAASAGQNYDAQFGFNTLNGQTFPSFNYGESYVGIGNGFYVADYQNHVQLSDTLSWIKGKHTFSFGADIRGFQFSRINLIGESGTFNFGRNQTAATPLSNTNSGNGFASFLLGELSSASASVPLRYPRSDSYYYAGFIQDDFKVTRSLVLNLGLRYDVETPPREAADDTSIFSPTTPNPGAGGLPGALVFSGSGPGRSGRSSQWANTWYKDVAPRIGFAWSPSVFHQKTAFRGSYGLMYTALPPTFQVPASAGFTALPSFSDSNTLGGFSPVFNIDSGFPAFSRSVNFDPSQVNKQGTNYIDPSYGRPGMVNIWTFQIQQELLPDLILNVGYLGQRSTHLSSALNYPNALSPQFYGLGSALRGSAASNSVGVTAPFPGFSGTVAQALRPYPQYLGIGTSLENIGQASYNALLVKMERRFRNGFNVLLSYTWSQSLTDADSALPGILPASGIQNPFNLAGEKSVSVLNVPHSASISYLYELPFGQKKKFLNSSPLLDKLVGGWQIGGIQTYASGSPIAFGCATAIPGLDNCIRYNQAEGQPFVSSAAAGGNFNPFTDRYFNPTAFVDPNSPQRIAAGGGYQFGNLSRISALRNPFSSNESFSIIKRISVAEKLRIELWGELFNAFNRHIFAAPNTSPNALAFGQVTSTANSPRQVQFRLRFLF